MGPERSPSEPKIQVKKYNPNMDLELDQDPELTPKIDLNLVLIWW